MTTATTSSAPGARFRALLERPEPLVLPGAVDALSARIAASVGFEAVYATGAGFANVSFGRPDVGLVTASELADHVARMCEAVAIPVVVDIDTGFGNAINAQRTLRMVERAGAAGVQIEDQVFPKRCGHFSGKDVIGAPEMLGKLRAVLDARTDPSLVVIARTDAIAVEGVEPAIERALAFVEAGADLVFVEAPAEREILAQLPKRIPALLLANMVEGGRTPLAGARELGEMGYRVVLFANTAMRVAAAAAREAYRVLRETGDSASLLDRMLSWQDRQTLVGLPEIEALEERYRGS